MTRNLLDVLGAESHVVEHSPARRVVGLRRAVDGDQLEAGVQYRLLVGIDAHVQLPLYPHRLLEVGQKGKSRIAREVWL